LIQAGVHGRAALLLAVSVSLLLATPALRADSIGKIESEVEDIRQRAKSLSSQYLGKGGFRGENYAAERLIDGENFYRLKDYQRAAIIFMDIIESYPNHAAYPDALFYFADSLFLSRDYYGAREWFRRLLNETHRSGVARFRHKALGRLIEIAIHLDDYEGVEEYFQQLGQAPDDEARYIKGKYLYFRGDFGMARQEFATVKGEGELALKAQYLIGASLTKEGRYDEAIAVFKEGVKAQTANPAEQEVVDLMNLALGRLYYEKDFVEHASAAYQRVGQHSRYFDTALYEAASVLIRAGDTIRAERTLEVLTLALPDSRYIPRAKLLRGNLLLRSGRYDEAERVFEDTISEFTPVTEQLDQLIAEQGDTSQFFADLMERSLTTLDVSSALPPLVVKWVGEEPDVRRAIALTADLGVAREYARETERLVRLLEAVINGPSRINAIPTLRAAVRQAQQLSNRLGQLRGRLLRIEQEKLGSADPAIAKLRQERAQLQKKLDSLPTTEEQFNRREEKSRAVFQRMRHELARNEIRLDRLIAMIVALERFVQDPKYTEGVPEQNIKALREELGRHRKGIADMRESLVQLRDDVENARYQVGVGDAEDREDREIRRRIRELSKKERALLSGRGGDLGRRLDRVYSAIELTEDVIDAFEQKVMREAERQIAEMRKLVKAESDRVAGYRAELVSLNEEAEEVIGGVTFENFTNVRKRFHELILKADVGIIDVAWMRKEEHGTRRNELTKDRLNEIKALDDEFQEVIKSDEEKNQGQ
jgi:TolA-binding protein